jgi:hypothetical protein
MVRKYDKKSNRQKWNENDMANAIDDVIQKKMGCKKAASTYNVPRTTLQRRIIKYNANPDLEIAAKKGLGNFKPIFNKEQELELARYIKDMENRLFGLSTKDLRELAFQLAEHNQKTHNFNKTLGMAGEDWLTGFLRRNVTLSLRKPEATSAARAMGFNKVVVNKFYDLLSGIIDKYKITPNRVYNVDETGITTVAKSLTKIIATKGKKQVGTLSSAERGQLLTVEICMGADGSYMPPLFIFPRVRMKNELLDGATPGSWAECNEEGWIQKGIFIKWLKKFIIWSRVTKESPILLLLDGHASHTKSLELINIARENGVILLCFPPHCTHRLQPLDVSFMKYRTTIWIFEISLFYLRVGLPGTRQALDSKEVAFKN